MKKAISVFAIGIVSISLLTLVIGLFLPDHWEAESTAIIDAPADQLLPRVNSFKEWESWATFEMRKADPSLEVTYSGPDSGKGATFSWTGERMGTGRLTITKVEERTVYYESAIQSETPNGQGWIKLEHTSEGTRVTWHDEGKLPPVYGGYFAATIEQNLKTQFSAALAKLKETSEQPED
ncbi:MAG: SRPBCC family protein [Planctomycetes bacterium]|nr:SRPBCC family protein [Planctomycetota bacterium]